MERKDKVLNDILKSEKPLSASALASKYGVSRQIIVGDVALLRAAGYKVMATPRGYILENNSGMSKTIAVRHTDADIENEMNIVVDFGGRIEEIIVEHPVYGEIKGNLHITSRYEVKKFIESMQNSEAKPLSTLTGGIHLHTISYDDEEVMKRIEEALDEAGYLLK